MKVAILGYGLEGRAAFDYWSGTNEITICDQYPGLETPDGALRQLGDHYLHDLDRFDLIVRSPQIHPRFLQGIDPSKITSNVNEFLRVCPTRNIIGVTGTKGKGTTSTLIAKMLEAAGRRVILGGNIGVPALQLLNQDIQGDDYVVLELSNFQLIDLKSSPHLAVCLMVVPEHLDWHTDFEEYLTAKQQLFVHQTEADIAVYYPANENSVRITGVSAGRHIPYYETPGAVVSGDAIVINGQEICKTDELKLLGQHNWQNVCAAITTVWQITQDIPALRSVITTFTGLPYRLEFIRELDGVSYYNDSFGTTPETAIVAIEAFTQPKVVILGGSSKGADFAVLARTIAASNIRHVLLIGNTANQERKTDTPAIAAALQAAGVTAVTSFVGPGGGTMTEIVAAAKYVAQPGDVVLLSAACASFDMFRDYKDRGSQFTAAVLAL